MNFKKILDVLLLGDSCISECPRILIYGEYIATIVVINWEDDWDNNSTDISPETLRNIEVEYLGERFKLSYDNDACLQIKYKDVITTYPYEEDDYLCFQPVLALLEEIYQGEIVNGSIGQW